MRILKLSLIPLLALIMYLLLLRNPNFLFAFQHKYKCFTIYSDQPIHEKIVDVLDDVLNRIGRSELYDNDKDAFSIYICNTSWRLTLFTRNPNIGGLVNQGLSNNVYIRAASIEKNEIESPAPGHEIALANERPLSYFIAHEITHSLQTKIKRFMHLTTPTYIVEGYADYIGKGDAVGFDDLLDDFEQNHFSMEPSSGLYNRYHLMVAFLIDVKAHSFQEITRLAIPEGKVEQELKNYIQ